MYSLKKIDFYGLNISVFQKKEILDYFKYVIENNKKIVCYGYSFGAIAYMTKYKEIFQYGNQSDIILADGRLFYLFLKIYKIPIVSDISIPDIVNLTLDLANKNKYSILLFGSTQETNDLATENIKKKYPNIITKKGINGFFKNEEGRGIVKKINEIKPDILYIGISTPIKERFSIEKKDDLNVRIIIPCGGMIDVLSGKSRQSGKVIKKVGLASLYRLIQEPKRLHKRYFFIYTFILFNFLPVFIWNTIFLKKRNFNIPLYYKLNT